MSAWSTVAATTWCFLNYSAIEIPVAGVPTNGDRTRPQLGKA